MGCIVVVHSLLMYDRMCSPTTCRRGTRQVPIDASLWLAVTAEEFGVLAA